MSFPTACPVLAIITSQASQYLAHYDFLPKWIKQTFTMMHMTATNEPYPTHLLMIFTATLLKSPFGCFTWNSNFFSVRHQSFLLRGHVCAHYDMFLSLSRAGGRGVIRSCILQQVLPVVIKQLSSCTLSLQTRQLILLMHSFRAKCFVTYIVTLQKQRKRPPKGRKFGCMET